MEVGERVRITSSHGQVCEMFIMHVTSLIEAPTLAKDASWMKSRCVLIDMIFGPDTKILWVADIDIPFIANGVNGFPVALTPTGATFDLGGEKLTLKVI